MENFCVVLMMEHTIKEKEKEIAKKIAISQNKNNG